MPLVTPPEVTTVPSSTTRWAITVAPRAARSARASWWVVARLAPMTPAWASSSTPVHTPAMTEPDPAASDSKGNHWPRRTSAQAPASDRATQPPPGTMTTSASPGLNSASGWKRIPNEPLTHETAVRLHSLAWTSAPMAAARRRTSSGPTTSSSSTPSKTTTSTSTGISAPPGTLVPGARAPIKPRSSMLNVGFLSNLARAKKRLARQKNGSSPPAVPGAPLRRPPPGGGAAEGPSAAAGGGEEGRPEGRRWRR